MNHLRICMCSVTQCHLVSLELFPSSSHILRNQSMFSNPSGYTLSVCTQYCLCVSYYKWCCPGWVRVRVRPICDHRSQSAEEDACRRENLSSFLFRLKGRPIEALVLMLAANYRQTCHRLRLPDSKGTISCALSFCLTDVPQLSSDKGQFGLLSSIHAHAPCRRPLLGFVEGQQADKSMLIGSLVWRNHPLVIYAQPLHSV